MSRDLELREARIIAEAALQAAAELKVFVAVALVDRAGHPVLTARADGATFLAGRMALRKAVTAAGANESTERLANDLADRPAVLTGFASQPEVALVPGGLPVIEGNVLIGAVGVSGASVDDDVIVARKGIDALLA